MSVRCQKPTSRGLVFINLWISGSQHVRTCGFTIYNAPIKGQEMNDEVQNRLCEEIVGDLENITGRVYDQFGFANGIAWRG